jgi:hypothetical protein
MTAFDPHAWLARFEATGGGWVVQDGSPVLLCPPGARECDSCLAQLNASGQRDMVLWLVLDRHAAKEMQEPAE